MNSISIHGMCGHLDCGFKSYEMAGMVHHDEFYMCQACDHHIVPIYGDGANKIRIKWKEMVGK